MEDQYGMADLRQYLGNRPLYPPPPPDLLSTHRGLNPYDMLIFRSDSTASVTTNAGASSSAACFGGFESSPNGGGDGGTGRWPRQETLSLLEIRSRLDPKFKEANQKGPLWDEVSRMMSEEHGYHRSGKKCREKFENLYKYYKKTKEGKAGRQDGKHYRFFRQLDALYGPDNNNGNSNSNPPSSENHPNFKSQQHDMTTSLSLSNYSDAETTSEEENSKESNKLKIREFIDAQMKKLMDKQEAWMDKMMRTIEQKERDRMAREAEWRRQDAARVDREHKFWATERAWIEARDAALMDALNRITASRKEEEDDVVWPDSEINRLVQVRAGMEGRFQGGGEEAELWEEVASKMACGRSGMSCKDKWDSVNNYLIKKRMKSSCCYYQSHEPISNHGGVYGDDDQTMRLNDNENENGNPAIGMSTDGCLRYFMGDGYGRIID